MALRLRILKTLGADDSISIWPSRADEMYISSLFSSAARIALASWTSRRPRPRRKRISLRYLPAESWTSARDVSREAGTRRIIRLTSRTATVSSGLDRSRQTLVVTTLVKKCSELALVLVAFETRLLVTCWPVAW